MQWTAGRIGAVGAAILGAAYAGFVLNERRTEQPPFDGEVEDGEYSIRRYPALRVVGTRVAGDRREALNRGFRRLARYIFAKDRPDGDRERIAMTAPVLSKPAGGGWTTRFVMPQALQGEGALPRPGPDLMAETLPARRVAAMRFTGRANDADLASREADLRRWLVTRGEAPVGPAEYAFYNSPMVAPALRRNEVLIPLA